MPIWHTSATSANLDLFGGVRAAVVPGPTVGDGLVQRLRAALQGLPIVVAPWGTAPAELGKWAVELGHNGPKVLIIRLDGQHAVAAEEAADFWRQLNYQRERLATGSLRTCLLINEQNDGRMAIIAVDLQEWISFLRFPEVEVVRAKWLASGRDTSATDCPACPRP